jgi:hypothetical protein
MDIIRNPDGTLTVPVAPDRHAEDAETEADGPPAATTLTLHPGEGGYNEALAQWDLQQDSSRGAAVSTPSGREEAMALVHAVATDPKGDVSQAIEALDDAESSAEALRHVLVGGDPSVAAFADEVAEAKGGHALPAHKMTKIIGEVLAALDS